MVHIYALKLLYNKIYNYEPNLALLYIQPNTK